jgi:hypothetical protein
MTWETPRNIAILTAAIAAITAGVSFVLGYKIGSAPPQQIIVHVHLDVPLIQSAPK